MCRCSMSTRRRTSTIGFARHGAETLASTGHKHRPMKPVASLSHFFFFLSSSLEVGEEEWSVSELLSRSLSCARKAFSCFLALY